MTTVSTFSKAYDGYKGFDGFDDFDDFDCFDGFDGFKKLQRTRRLRRKRRIQRFRRVRQLGRLRHKKDHTARTAALRVGDGVTINTRGQTADPNELAVVITATLIGLLRQPKKKFDESNGNKTSTFVSLARRLLLVYAGSRRSNIICAVRQLKRRFAWRFSTTNNKPCCTCVSAWIADNSNARLNRSRDKSFAAGSRQDRAT